MIIRIIASAIVIFGGMYLGRYMAEGLKIRTVQLSSFGEALKQLEFNIRFFNMPVCDAICGVSETRTDVVGSIFKRGGEILKNKSDALVSDAWERAVAEHKRQLLLNDDELEILNSFIHNLGAGDKESEIDNISAACLKLKEAQTRATEELCKNEKLYRTSGLLIGLLFVIVTF